jgi:hypothetical protein
MSVCPAFLADHVYNMLCNVYFKCIELLKKTAFVDNETLCEHRLLFCMICTQRSLPRAWHFWIKAWYKWVQYVLEKSSAPLWKGRNTFWRRWNICRYVDSLTCGPCIGMRILAWTFDLLLNWIQKAPKDLHCEFWTKPFCVAISWA